MHSDNMDFLDWYYDCLCKKEVYGTGDIWQTREGEQIKLINLHDKHLDNCLKFLNRRLDDCTLTECCQDYIYSRMEDLHEERKRREYEKEERAKSTVVCVVPEFKQEF